MRSRPFSITFAHPNQGTSFACGRVRDKVEWGAFAMHIAIRLFVGAVFAVLATAFIGLSAVLYHEFNQSGWFALATFDSQLFLFFPIFGVMALIAFYLPACVMLDIYWRHVTGGRWMISIALVLLIALAPLAAELMKGPAKALWDLTPQALSEDTGEHCNLPNPDLDRAGLPVPGKPGSCTRLPFLQALKNMRAVAREQSGMSVFVRNCRPNRFIATPSSEKEEHYCFVNNQMQTAKACCAAQKRFTNALQIAFERQGGDSKTRMWYRRLLPVHILFLLLIFGLGVSLARRGKWLDLPEYADVRSAVETRVLAGAILMLFWPLLNHSFLQSADILYGNVTNSAFRTIAPFFTVIFGVWSLMLLFFFFRSFPETVKRVGQIAGVIASALAFLRFDEIVGALSRMMGSGADQTTIGIVLLVVISIILFATLNRRLLTSDPGASDRPGGDRVG